jgi:hypothetical protein
MEVSVVKVSSVKSFIQVARGRGNRYDRCTPQLRIWLPGPLRPSVPDQQYQYSACYAGGTVCKGMQYNNVAIQHFVETPPNFSRCCDPSRRAMESFTRATLEAFRIEQLHKSDRSSFIQTQNDVYRNTGGVPNTMIALFRKGIQSR